MLGQRSGAAAAYDRFAPVYDDFNLQNDYEAWLGQVLLPEMAKHGLKEPSGHRGGRALDVGCGTGRAFDPLLSRGWRVCGVDASAGMLEEAAKHSALSGVGKQVSLAQADARELPVYSEPFDLILALNDIVNYLTEDGDLELFFRGVARNLAPNGLVCFDANSLGLMRVNFAGEGMERGEWTWRGRAETVEPGGTYEAVVSGPGIPDNVHRQRHWTAEEVLSALGAAGLTCHARLGQREEDGQILMSEPVDEERDAKVIYVGGHHG